MAHEASENGLGVRLRRRFTFPAIDNPHSSSGFAAAQYGTTPPYREDSRIDRRLRLRLRRSLKKKSGGLPKGKAFPHCAAAKPLSTVGAGGRGRRQTAGTTSELIKIPLNWGLGIAHLARSYAQLGRGYAQLGRGYAQLGQGCAQLGQGYAQLGRG